MARRTQHLERAAEGGDAIREPVQPGAVAGCGPAHAVVAHLDQQLSVDALARVTVARAACAYLDTLVRASETTK